MSYNQEKFQILPKFFQSFEGIIFKNRRLFVTVVHLLEVALANYLAFLIRFESILSPEYVGYFLSYIPILLLIRLIFYLQGGLYKNLWRYSSINDLSKIIQSATLGSLVFFIVIRYLINDVSYPRSIYILDWLLLIIISGGLRFFIRILSEYVGTQVSGKKVLMVGAGKASETIVRDLKKDPKAVYEPIGFIDDNPYRKGLTIHGVPILGTRSMIRSVIEQYHPDEILITIPSANREIIKEICDQCKPFNIPIKKLPGLADILDGNVSVTAKFGEHLIDSGVISESQLKEALDLQKREGGRLGSKLIKLKYITEDKLVSFLGKHNGMQLMKPISLEDLLQREPVMTEIETVKTFINGKTIIVTGAGGSIGSELCRQIVKYNPKNLILFDRYENSVFELDIELNSLENGKLSENITTVIGDILEKSRLEYVFSRYKPQIVFHAAAYKHVPLMESNAIEAVKNNILGTKNVIDSALRHDTENFVLISTDKAVNPNSIMGATKRIAELLTMDMSSNSRTKLTTVRFGNVLGSNGSVIPLFQEQLKRGGPLKVTHPDVKRYFMLNAEAVQLVLIAASSGNNGKIFVLDMGEPIKILDLTENLIRLSGFIPHKEIKIEFTGLRPGEKLSEELFDESEEIVPAFHDKLRIAAPKKPIQDNMDKYIAELEQIVNDSSIDNLIPFFEKILPNFRHL
jgi:FlaA1/EpsC-like NDP-sugar epimerase